LGYFYAKNPLLFQKRILFFSQKGGVHLILLENVSKTYESKRLTVEALKGVNLKIEGGDIFGIIGYSGAGKSTLIRCINLLEKPDTGRVVIKDVDLTALSQKQLRKQREKIGMIFQHFNLMNRRNVYENVAYPLKGKGLSKKEVEEKVFKLLELVGIKDKVYSYPSQLSGGQKQRVAIARALANDPEVLLCDEATSALDPQNTRAILGLLKEINRKLNLTIVLITHQMDVIKEICNKVAVMEGGEVVEEAGVIEVFSNPKANITKEFIAHSVGSEKLDKAAEQEFLRNAAEYEVAARLLFVGQAAGQAFISKISIEYGVMASILFGSIENIQDVPFGRLNVRFSGNKAKVHEAIKYLERNHIKVEVLKENGDIESVDAQCNRVIS
jgi:D-methionine transport system ATP-binding protein